MGTEPGGAAVTRGAAKITGCKAEGEGVGWPRKKADPHLSDSLSVHERNQTQLFPHLLQKSFKLRSGEYRGDMKKEFPNGEREAKSRTCFTFRMVLCLCFDLCVTAWPGKRETSFHPPSGNHLSPFLVSGFLFEQKSQPHCYRKEKQKALDMNSPLEIAIHNSFVNLKPAY